MRQRTISAAVMVPVVLVVYLLGQPWLTLGLAALAAVGAGEAFRLLRAAGLPVLGPAWTAGPPIAVLGLGLGASPLLVALFAAAVIILAAIDAFRRQDVREGFLAWVGTSFGVLYVSLLAFLALITAVDVPVGGETPPAGAVGDAVTWLGPGRTWLLVLVLTVWSFDTFAYLSGRTFGRGRFLNHISPNKTWSGVIGGTVAATIMAGLLAWALGQGLAGLPLGLLVAITAQAGDVAESMLKRAAGAKDSGTLIPGHGGILDRVDSLLFAGPAMVAWLIVIAAA